MGHNSVPSHTSYKVGKWFGFDPQSLSAYSKPFSLLAISVLSWVNNSLTLLSSI